MDKSATSVMITLLLATAHRGVTVERYDTSLQKVPLVFRPRLRFSLVDFNPGGILPTGRRPPHGPLSGSGNLHL